jgi:hypothetical protein
MGLTPEEQAQLDALTAKRDAPEETAPRKIVTVAADVLDTIRQLVHVHWEQIAPGIAQEFTRAVDEAKDEDGDKVKAEPEPEPEPEPAEPEPAEPAEPEAAPAVAEPVPVFGTETSPGSESQL